MEINSFMRQLLFKGRFRRTKIFLTDAILFVFIDLVHYLLSGHTAYGTPVENGLAYFVNSLILFAAVFGSRYLFKIYDNIWRYANTRAYFLLVVADSLGGLTAILICRVIGLFNVSYYIGVWYATTVASLTALASLLSRFVYQLIYNRANRSRGQTDKGEALSHIAIVGAGRLGAHLASELVSSKGSRYVPVCFIDSDVQKRGKSIAGLVVVSPDEEESAMKKYGFSEVVIAIENRDREKTECLWKHYTALGCKIKIYDAPLSGEGADDGGKSKPVIRDFSIEDILFRKPLDINGNAEFEYYEGKTVLVTGGGGSIGSELCRQLAGCGVKKLIIFDIYENNAYDIQQELVRKYGGALDLSVEIGSVRDAVRLEGVFKNYRPDVVFHAAAHKHVPLMEQSGCEAIKNNVFGTYNTADMAEKYNAEKFILISTDKAVNPTNIMGASKRLCEMVVQCRVDSKTSFAAVRFGNVLGSNGSVIPLFKRQIASGGPVTITDKRIIRYFMTIPEASQLVMEAGAMAKKGELFVLDMGKPVRIYDLAKNMIKLSGFEPEVDIKIEEIGLRPGEKLYEELLMKTETLDMTDNKMIFIEKDKPYTRDEVNEKLSILSKAVEDSRAEIGSVKVKAAIVETVPTFREPNEINKNAASSKEMKEATK